MPKRNYQGVYSGPSSGGPVTGKSTEASSLGSDKHIKPVSPCPAWNLLIPWKLSSLLAIQDLVQELIVVAPLDTILTTAITPFSPPLNTALACHLQGTLRSRLSGHVLWVFWAEVFPFNQLMGSLVVEWQRLFIIAELLQGRWERQLVPGGPGIRGPGIMEKHESFHEALEKTCLVHSGRRQSRGMRCTSDSVTGVRNWHSRQRKRNVI